MCQSGQFLAALALVAIAPLAAAAQQAEKKPEQKPDSAKAKVEVKAEAPKTEAAAPAAARALEGATITSVRIVDAKQSLDAAGAVAFEAALEKSEAALAAANLSADRIVGVSVANGVATVFVLPAQ